MKYPNNIYKVIEDNIQFNKSRSNILYINEFGMDNLNAVMAEASKIYSSNIDNIDATIYVFGWIDQAIPEIHMATNVKSAIKEIMLYKAEQNGDTGLIVELDNRYMIMEVLYDNGLIRVFNYIDA